MQPPAVRERNAVFHQLDSNGFFPLQGKVGFQGITLQKPADDNAGKRQLFLGKKRITDMFHCFAAFDHGDGLSGPREAVNAIRQGHDGGFAQGFGHGFQAVAAERGNCSGRLLRRGSHSR